MENESAVCRNIQNSCYYRHLGGNTYRNLTTGAEGEITTEIASRVLKINMDATMLMNKYPLLEEFVERLKLKGEI